MAKKDASICAKAGSLCGKSAFSGKAVWQSSVYEFESTDVMVLPTPMSSQRPWLSSRAPSKPGGQEFVWFSLMFIMSLATSSGMGALVVAILSICKAGDLILAQSDCYGGSREFLEIDAPRFGIKTQFIDVHNVQTLELALKNSVIKRETVNGRTLHAENKLAVKNSDIQRETVNGRTLHAENKLAVKNSVIQRETVNGRTLHAENKNNSIIVFLESITNPCVRVADLQSISIVCKMYGAFLIVDNTFPTPVRIKPLKQGADMVIHSVTKFLGGHSDLVAGVVVGSSHHIELASILAVRWGLIAPPFDSWLATKGITTLQVRMERALSTTAELARRILCSSIPVKLNWTPDCAIMSIQVAGGVDGASRAVSNLKMIKFVPSLGGTTTTVSHPVSTSHTSLPTAEREAMGITDGMLRLSVGLEDVEDIWIDIQRGLLAAAATDNTSDF
ncbi:hypothetical protein SUGI_1179560 [Cryptomeria japonica]|nr:hypothetical protein SUGI_1179560 [Cryptomeria japonica]